jgi:hypothetical protein
MILPRVVAETCSVLAAGERAYAVELNSSFNTIRSGGLEIGVFLEQTGANSLPTKETS